MRRQLHCRNNGRLARYPPVLQLLHLEAVRSTSLGHLAEVAGVVVAVVEVGVVAVVEVAVAEGRETERAVAVVGEGRPPATKVSKVIHGALRNC